MILYPLHTTRRPALLAPYTYKYSGMHAFENSSLCITNSENLLWLSACLNKFSVFKTLLSFAGLPAEGSLRKVNPVSHLYILHFSKPARKFRVDLLDIYSTKKLTFAICSAQLNLKPVTTTDQQTNINIRGACFLPYFKITN